VLSCLFYAVFGNDDVMPGGLSIDGASQAGAAPQFDTPNCNCGAWLATNRSTPQLKRSTLGTPTALCQGLPRRVGWLPTCFGAADLAKKRHDHVEKA